MNTKLFPLRLDELPVIGRFIYTSLVRDVTSFVPYTAFDAPYPANYLGQLVLVEAAASPVVIINQMKLVTFNLLTDVYSLHEKMNQCEIYFISAGSGLNVLPKDMGQRAVRREVNKGDVEALIGKLGILNESINANSAALIGVGFTLVNQEALVTLTTAIRTNNNLQNTLWEQRSTQANANMTLFNSFWTNYVSKTAKTGKLIFKVSNKTKAKDYTVSLLKGRIRHDQAQTVVFGMVTLSDGTAVNRAKVKLVPVDGGRTKTVYTDADGKYRVSGMRATDYNEVVTKDALVKVTAITVATRDQLEVNVTLS